MSLLRTFRQPNLVRSVASSTATTPSITVASRRFAHQDYGSGDAKPDTSANQTQRDAEHPGPPPPKAAQQGKDKQQEQPSSGEKQQQSNNNSTSGAQPKILNDNPPAQGEESEEVARHNREVQQRADRAEERIKNEDAEKDKVPKGFWSGTGGAEKQS